MTIIPRYLFKQVAGATAIVLLVVFGLDIVFRLANELGQLGKDYNAIKALQYVLLGSPLQFYSVMPLVAMIGCLLGLGTLATSSELIIMRSIGLSTYKLTWLAIRPTLVFLVAAVLIGELVAPKSEMYADSVKTLAKSGIKQQDLTSRFWLRDKTNFVFIQVVKPNGQLHGLSLYEFDENQQIKQLRKAKQAVFTGQNWQLTQVERIEFHSDVDRLTEITEQYLDEDDWVTDIQPDFLKVAVSNPRDLPMHDLYSYIAYLESQSLSAIEYKLAFWEKVFYPLMVLSLILVGIAFVFGPLRQVTMGFRLFCGVMIGVLVKTLQTAVGPLSMVFGIHPILAMAIPSIFCIALGLFLLSRVK